MGSLTVHLITAHVNVLKFACTGNLIVHQIKDVTSCACIGKHKAKGERNYLLISLPSSSTVLLDIAASFSRWLRCNICYVAVMYRGLLFRKDERKYIAL